MLALDVNILVYAHREDAPDHGAYHRWLSEVMRGPEPFAVPDLVCSGFLRIVTHPQIFSPPSSLEIASAFLAAVRSRPNFMGLNPGERHWGIYLNLCKESRATGNLVPDAYLAAVAIENGAEWVTTDKDYARFPGLKWRHPFSPRRSR